jgi:hypothetical protein
MRPDRLTARIANTSIGAGAVEASKTPEEGTHGHGDR